MLLAVDIGNSSISTGLFSSEGTLLHHFCLPVDPGKTPEQYRDFLVERLKTNGIALRSIGQVAIASVVGKLSSTLQQVSRLLWRSDALVIGYQDIPELKICYGRPETVGIDRLLAALAAYKSHGAPLIVIDVGTAVTIDVVSATGEFLGGIIAPGPRICAEALAEKTSLLPQIELQPPSELIGRSTEEAIRSGVVCGTAELVDGLVRRIKRQMEGSTKVVGTGGFADLISPESKTIETVDPHLVLKGIQITHNYLRK
ncbi:MAG: type III pantothenate kinase [Candidatus Latescibacteria bacterium]|nr:type III pantothenate kinase [Candidatus Latescibacterota bacterium]